MLDQARPHHYLFVHNALRDLVLRDWENTRPAFADGSGTARLTSVWTDLSARIAEPDRLDAGDAISVEPVNIGSHQGFLIRVPSPEAPGEGGLVLVPDVSPATRYFVLELGLSVMDHTAHWVFCEWEPTRHLNGGNCGIDPGISVDAALPDMLAMAAQRLDSGTTA